MFVFDDQAIAAGQCIRPRLDDPVEVFIHIQDVFHAHQTTVFRSVICQDRTGPFFLIDGQDSAGTGITDLTDVDDDVVDRLLKVRRSVELDTGIQYGVGDLVVDLLRHLLGVGILRDFLRIGAVVDISLVMQWQQKQIEPEVEAIRVHVSMYRFFQDSSTIADLFEVQILREIILI